MGCAFEQAAYAGNQHPEIAGKGLLIFLAECLPSYPALTAASLPLILN